MTIDQPAINQGERIPRPNPLGTPPSGKRSMAALLPDTESDSRGRERLLLILTGLFLFVNWLGLLLVRVGDAGNILPNLLSNVLTIWPLPVWIGAVVVGHAALNRLLPGRDPFLFPLTMLLTGWGLVEIARLSAIYATRQTLWLALALAALIGVLRLPRDLRWLSRYRYVWLGVGLLALTGAVLLRSNPVDLIKLSLLAFMASYLSENRDLFDAQAIQIGPLRIPSPRHLLPLIGIWLVSALILVWQRALGIAVLYLIILLLLLYVSTGRPFYVIGGGLLLVGIGALAYVLYGVARQRVGIWLDPWSAADSSAYQIVQSLIAVGNGGVFGQGIGQGAPVYIPVAHSDFIYAAIGEEWGLFGMLAILGSEAVLSIRAIRMSISQSQPFRALLCIGIGLTFAIQSALIMAGSLKLIPLTGITLPLVSYGGSSLIISFVLVGLLLVISADS